ncbi:MAG: hypothetical protein AB7V27_08730 [Candidatus Binatia bacterium]
MAFESWRAFYHSDLQSVWLLIAAPSLFLLYWAVSGRRRTGGALPSAAPFVQAYAVVFAVAALLDPLATGPVARALGLADGAGGTAFLLFFVLLGDFRVFLLLFALPAMAAGRHWRAAVPCAAAWTLFVPVLAYAGDAVLHTLVPRLGASSIWLVYEVLFTSLALVLRARVGAWLAIPPDSRLCAYARELLAYVAIYYALWAAADVLIQLAGRDAGWLLRTVPNQLYYGFWVPFAFWRFFARA